MGYQVFHQRNQLRNLTLSNPGKETSTSDVRDSAEKVSWFLVHSVIIIGRAVPPDGSFDSASLVLAPMGRAGSGHRHDAKNNLHLEPYRTWKLLWYGDYRSPGHDHGPLLRRTHNTLDHATADAAQQLELKLKHNLDPTTLLSSLGEHRDFSL